MSHALWLKISSLKLIWEKCTPAVSCNVIIVVIIITFNSIIHQGCKHVSTWEVFWTYFILTLRYSMSIPITLKIITRKGLSKPRLWTLPCCSRCQKSSPLVHDICESIIFHIPIISNSIDLPCIRWFFLIDWFFFFLDFWFLIYIFISLSFFKIHTKFNIWWSLALQYFI